MLEPTKKSQPGDSGGFIHSRTKRQTEIKYVYKTKKKDMIHILEINNTSTQKMHVCVFSAVCNAPVSKISLMLDHLTSTEAFGMIQHTVI